MTDNFGTSGSALDFCTGQCIAERTILALNRGGAACTGPAFFSCSDLWGNEGGDWVGPIADQAGRDGNISADPLFCNPGAGDLRLRSDSPCRPFPPENPACNGMGAWPVGCGSSEVAGGIATGGATAWPNPTAGECRILISGGEAGPGRPRPAFTARIYDAAGRNLRVLAATGSGTVLWDGRDAWGREVPAGVYPVRIEQPGGNGPVGRVALRVVRIR